MSPPYVNRGSATPRVETLGSSEAFEKNSEVFLKIERAAPRAQGPGPAGAPWSIHFPGGEVSGGGGGAAD